MARPCRCTNGADRTLDARSWPRILPCSTKGTRTLPFIAEDLGLITPDVCALRDEFNIPEQEYFSSPLMDVLDNPHLPANYSTNTVVYTGTHDNNTTRGWFESLSVLERERIRAALNRPDCEIANFAEELIRMAWCSAAGIGYHSVARLAESWVPNRERICLVLRIGNWSWRATEDLLNGSDPQSGFEI